MERLSSLVAWTTTASTCTRPTHQAYQSYHAGAIGSGRNTVIEFFEDNWKENMTLNAAMKLGLEGSARPTTLS